VVRPARLKLALLAALVLLAHLVGVEWIARQVEEISGLKLMVAPMYTRMLRPAAPPPVVATAAPAPSARPSAGTAVAPRPPASAAEAARRRREAEERARRAEAEERARQRAELKARAEALAKQLEEQERQAREQLAQAQPPASAASGPQAAASAPAVAASAAPSDQAALDQWPVDTRLSYALTGQFRGPLYGDAQVLWQREGSRYQVRLAVHVQVFGTQVLTSQGEVTPTGLVPRAYEELRPGKRRFARIGDDVVTLENGRTVPTPPGVQDSASQFVELTQRFASGREKLEVGRSIPIWLARPGGVDLWIYDVLGREELATPKFGTIEAYHLKPRSITNPRGDYSIEMWFAPSLQYLPARIRLTKGDEAWIDLVVDHIEQR
jgi:hypothetical protein